MRQHVETTGSAKTMEYNMLEADFLIWVITGLLTVLTALIGFIGSRIYFKVDEMATSMAAIEKDLRMELSRLDRRVAILEHDSGNSVRYHMMNRRMEGAG